jgi:hypothetical protein
MTIVSIDYFNSFLQDVFMNALMFLAALIIFILMYIGKE